MGRVVHSTQSTNSNISHFLKHPHRYTQKQGLTRHRSIIKLTITKTGWMVRPLTKIEKISKRRIGRKEEREEHRELAGNNESSKNATIL